MGANIISCFLYPIRFNSSRVCCIWAAYTISLPHFVYTIFFRVFKLIPQPVSLLLEDEGSEASGEKCDQRILVSELIGQAIYSSSKHKLMLVTNSNKANQPLLLIKSGLFPAGTGCWEAKQFTDPQL